jgi:excisionase family DNA binding protein
VLLHGGCEALLAIRAVAARLGVSTATVYALCETGQLRHVRILNALRIAESDLVDFVEGNKTRAYVPAKPPAIRPATRHLPASDNERSKQ